MAYSQDILKAITEESKRAIARMDVVTPSVYASIFTKYAFKHNVSIEDEPGLAQDLLMTECSNMSNVQEETSKNADRLSNSTSKAIDAIKNKDETKLTEALNETNELKQEIEKLKERVYKDELTRAYNRKWLHDNLLKDEQFKKTGILAIIDLNYFKDINDTYGHVIGDKVLLLIATQLKKSQGTVIRYGGDEFILLFDGETNKDLVLRKLNIIRDSIIKKNLKIKDISFKVSFSFGAQEFKSGDYLNNIIDAADKHMYRDKIQIKKIVTGI
ncbi:MAG: GGDEF domain-containing protein [Campylobacterales bacterium]|nr:GGDEF domain-containing protein [Campylobacterales bacterium]